MRDVDLRRNPAPGRALVVSHEQALVLASDSLAEVAREAAQPRQRVDGRALDPHDHPDMRLAQAVTQRVLCVGDVHRSSAQQVSNAPGEHGAAVAQLEISCLFVLGVDLFDDPVEASGHRLHDLQCGQHVCRIVRGAAEELLDAAPEKPRLTDSVRADQRGGRYVGLSECSGVLDRRRWRGRLVRVLLCRERAKGRVQVFPDAVVQDIDGIGAEVGDQLDDDLLHVFGQRVDSFCERLAYDRHPLRNGRTVLRHRRHRIDAARRRPRLVSSPANVEGRWANLSSRVDEVIRSIWSRSSTTVTDRRLRPRSWTRSSTLPTSARERESWSSGAAPVSSASRSPQLARTSRVSSRAPTSRRSPHQTSRSSPPHVSSARRSRIGRCRSIPSTRWWSPMRSTGSTLTCASRNRRAAPSGRKPCDPAHPPCPRRNSRLRRSLPARVSPQRPRHGPHLQTTAP